MKTLYHVTLLLFATALNAQTGKISGNVVDAKTGETLPGATILIEGTNKGTASDFDGNFSIIKLEPGTYAVTVQYISYNTAKFKGIVVKADQSTSLKVLLEPSSSQELQEVEVTVTLDKQNNTALVLQQKNAASVSDGISAETIKKTPDRNTSDVLKRVSGASIQDNRFAIIRGLSDRYNAAFINGAPLPSSESDRRAFSFDIFPANMLDNMIILKTATPDVPGEFAGGIININTRAVPEKNFQNISVGTSLHTLTTFKTFQTYDGGKFDWLGVDDGTRALPEGIPDNVATRSADEKANLAKKVTPSWGIEGKTARPALNLHYSIGRNYDKGSKRFGFIFGYTYLNNFTQNENKRMEYEESSTEVVKTAELNDHVYTNNVMSSALLNTAFKLNDNNQIALKNMYSINSFDRVNIRTGARDINADPPEFEQSSNRLFTQNQLYTGQLEGNHVFDKSKIRLKWIGGYSDVYRALPNQRRIVYRRDGVMEGDTPEPFAAVVQPNGTIPTAAGNMFWSTTREKIYNLNYNASIPLDFPKLKNEIKVGGMHQLRDRDFVARNLGFSRYRKQSAPSAPFENELLLLPEEEIFAPDHLGLQENGMGGFKLEEATKSHDSYQAKSMLNAGYAMTDSRIGEKLRVIAGVRLESYRQRFSYVEFSTNIDQSLDTTINDLLPSINLVYFLNEKTNLRAAYYRTVSRPEFRELAPFQFYNFELDNIISGDPDLQRALIDNADLRYEVFPGSGQLLSVSGFYKQFHNPIELFMRAGTSGASELTYTNVPSARNFGAEIEYRFKLDLITRTDSNLLFANTTLFTNVAIIRSEVDVSRILGANPRPLQGQSPFIINAGLNFTHPTRDWSASVSYNLIGRRIYIVGNVQEPDVWERGRHVLDAQITKTFNERLQLTLNVRDVLAQKLLFYQNIDEKQTYSEGVDNLWQVTTFGQTISFTASFRF